MGTCISIHNNIKEHTYINVSIIINNKLYSLYTSITNINRWYIYLPNFIIEKINENNFACKKTITGKVHFKLD
jgi:hypothetical protein